jgi:hypothetical protein
MAFAFFLSDAEHGNRTLHASKSAKNAGHNAAGIYQSNSTKMPD